MPTINPLTELRSVRCEISKNSFRIVAEFKYADESGKMRPPLVGRWMAQNAKQLATLATPDGQIWRAAGPQHDPQLPVYKPFTIHVSPSQPDVVESDSVGQGEPPEAA